MSKKITYVLIALLLCFTSAQIKAEVIDGRFYPMPSTSVEASKSIDNLIGHYKNKIKIIFSDIDGTLIPIGKNAGRGEVPESVKKAAQKLKQANIPFILVTGRSSIEALEIKKRAGIENAYIIAQQGAQIINPEGKFIFDDNISNSESKSILKEIDKFKKENKLKSYTFLFLDGDLYTKEKVDLPYIFQKITVLNSFDELDKIKKDYTLNKIGIYDCDIKSLKLIQQYLKNKYPQYHIDISADCYCDISSGSATKGNAVKKLAEILKYDLKNAATFGDAENDISMLSLINKSGGLAIAVGNAMPKTKASANYITLSASEGGFAKGVDKILENNTLLK